LSNQPSAICFLNGPGNIGKTQLALKYILNNEKYSDYIKIFIDCENIETFDKSLEVIASEIASNYGIADFRHFSPHNKTRTLSIVTEFLKKEDKYLLLIDNVDTQELSQEVDKLLSDKTAGKVIVTGRYKGAKWQSGCTIEVRSLTFEDGVKVFREAVREDSEGREALFS